MVDQIVRSIPIGIAFGLVVQGSGVASPDVIRAQFLFNKEIMMKMFLGALASSAFSMVLLSFLKPKEFDQARESKGWGDKGAVSAVVGGLIQGVGMAIAGACPGMAYAQLGMGTPNAALLYVGGLLGAFLYGFLHHWLEAHHAFDFAQTLEKKFDSMHLERVYFKGHFKAAAMSLGVVALAAALAVDALQPWKEDVLDVKAVRPTWRTNPILAGLVVGSLQIPVFSLIGTLLGSSSAYSVVSSQIYRLVPDELLSKHTYARRFINNKSSWQLGLGIGIFLGAAIASGYGASFFSSLVSRGSLQSRSAHVSQAEAFIGGLLIVFGARFAGGCASGHGITGLPSLHVVSWYTVPAMFAGAIGTAHVLSLLYGRQVFLLRA